MKGSRLLEILASNLRRVSPRADGNYNAEDFMWALDQAIGQAQEEEGHEG